MVINDFSVKGCNNLRDYLVGALDPEAIEAMRATDLACRLFNLQVEDQINKL